MEVEYSSKTLFPNSLKNDLHVCSVVRGLGLLPCRGSPYCLQVRQSLVLNKDKGLK